MFYVKINKSDRRGGNRRSEMEKNEGKAFDFAHGCFIIPRLSLTLKDMKPFVITDFSHAYPDQGFPEALMGGGVGFDLIDMTDIEGTRCYCDAAAASEIRRRIASFTGVPGIHWLDSGDYHYMTLFYASAFREPFTLVLLDNHPDDQEPEFPGVLSCGSWVKALRETCPGLVRTVSVGPGGARPAIPQPLGDVYLSIDKDILSPAFARTDWSQGAFELEEVERIVAEIFAGAGRVLGVDVCGELSTDHGATPEDRRINLETNLFLTDLLNRSYL